MPVVFRYKGYSFFFYSNEGEPLEPLHIHVRRGSAAAKFWLDEDISVPALLMGVGDRTRKAS
jgi:hypothetical protein